MKYTESNDIQEKPIFAIENDENITSSQELLDEPTIIIESSGEMKHNTSSDSIKKRGGLPKWSLAIMWFVATVLLHRALLEYFVGWHGVVHIIAIFIAERIHHLLIVAFGQLKFAEDYLLELFKFLV